SLEAAGLGNARKLAGQFTLRDFTVFKVMFSAIVTAMLGTFWLGRFGVISLASLYVPETFLVSQVLGGAIFGVGFVMTGLCPGTSCVAAASGRVDGFFTVLGLFAGVLLTGLSLPSMDQLYRSGAFGAYTLPAALGLPYGVVVAAVVLMAVGVFALIEQWEQTP
ncbi:MAG: YeeE/YedE family protein, partial [Asticcacaulis sp.]|nr:YeeE/YedE family protein [Asticcacaulis sp.]